MGSGHGAGLYQSDAQNDVMVQEKLFKMYHAAQNMSNVIVQDTAASAGAAVQETSWGFNSLADS